MNRISVYTTTKNCILMDYPFREAIRSTFNFADEIVVCDSSDLDKTKDELAQLKQAFELFKKGNTFIVVDPHFDYTRPNYGILDGAGKAFAREHCTGDYCYQIDADEIATGTNMESLCQRLDNDVPLMALPEIEYWGSAGKVRIDVNPWKWRLSKNLAHITHGIPAHLRRREGGLLYSRPGSDGCDYIDKNSGQVIPCMHFIKPEVEQLRQRAITDLEAARLYEDWFNKITDRLPTVYHFSWWSVYSKIHKYKKFWNNAWQSLYYETRPPGYNPFFNKPLEDVSENEMREMAKTLEEQTGGFIFHRPYDGSRTNSVAINKPIPKLIEEWCESHSSSY